MLPVHDGAAGALRTLKRTYWRRPVSLAPSVRNAYVRRTYDDDFDANEHPPAPFAVLSVDPEAIHGFTGQSYPPYHGTVELLGTVRNADWMARRDRYARQWAVPGHPDLCDLDGTGPRDRSATTTGTASLLFV